MLCDISWILHTTFAIKENVQYSHGGRRPPPTRRLNVPYILLYEGRTFSKVPPVSGFFGFSFLVYVVCCVVYCCAFAFEFGRRQASFIRISMNTIMLQWSGTVELILTFSIGLESIIILLRE